MQKDSWDWHINPDTKWFDSRLREIAMGKELLFRLVRKNFLSSYQQTLLGPFWILFNPIVTVIIYVIVFDKVIGISTGGVPSFIYYLSGIIMWNCFADLFQNIAGTMSGFADIFRKVYFARLIAPLSVLIIVLIQISIQLLFFIVVLFYFYLNGNIEFHFSQVLLAIPAFLFVVMQAFGAGMIFSVITAKYKDLNGVIQLIMRVLMFITPVFYSLNIVPEKLKQWVMINPLAPFFELWRWSFFGAGEINMIFLCYGMALSVLILFAGIIVFNKYSEKLLDVV